MTWQPPIYSCDLILSSVGWLHSSAGLEQRMFHSGACMDMLRTFNLGSSPCGVTRNALIKQLEVQIVFDHSVCEDRVVSF